MPDQGKNHTDKSEASQPTLDSIVHNRVMMHTGSKEIMKEV